MLRLVREEEDYHAGVDTHHGYEDVEDQRRDSEEPDGGSDDDLDTDDEDGMEDGSEGQHSVESFEEQFRYLEEVVATLVADVHDLALYTKLNLTGFMKILKVRMPMSYFEKP